MPLRACFKNRPVRGPGLQGFGILAIPRRPRALTRRPPTILKHALKPPSKPGAANPAIASRFNAGHHWRGVADPGRQRMIERPGDKP
jgi:hypothetical protein